MTDHYAINSTDGNFEFECITCNKIKFEETKPQVTECVKETRLGSNPVNHPDHYGGKDNVYEAIKVIEAWKLNFHLGNAIKYIARAGKKSPEKEKEDLKKAIWYLQRHIDTQL
jgi:hypothetical protein